MEMKGLVEIDTMDVAKDTLTTEIFQFVQKRHHFAPILTSL